MRIYKVLLVGRY